MRILVFCPYYHPHTGGLENFAADFHDHLALEEDIESIVVFTTNLPKQKSAKEIKGKISLVRFPAFEIIPNYPLPKIWTLSFWSMFCSLFGQKCDLVLSHTRFFNTSIMALFYAKIKRVRWVHIEHGSDFVQLNSSWKSWGSRTYDLLFGRFVLRTSDVNVSVSAAVGRFVKLFDRRPSPIIYRGIESEVFDEIEPAKEIIDQYPDKIKIVYIGRLIDGKGVADLVAAVKKMDQRRIICLIVGDGPERQNLEKQVIDLGLTDQFKFLGQKSFFDAISILKAGDIFINPSYTEGLPTTIIEAAVCGKAILATDVGGTAEIIKNNESGLLIKPRDIDGLSRNLDSLIKDDQLRKELGSRARLSVLKKFNWQKCLDQYRGLFGLA